MKSKSDDFKPVILVVIPKKSKRWHHCFIQKLLEMDFIFIHFIKEDISSTSKSCFFSIHYWLDQFIPHPIVHSHNIQTDQSPPLTIDYVLHLGSPTSYHEWLKQANTGVLYLTDSREKSLVHNPGYRDLSMNKYELHTFLYFHQNDKDSGMTFHSSQKLDRLSLRKNDQLFANRSALLIERFFLKAMGNNTNIKVATNDSSSNGHNQRLSISKTRPFYYHLQSLLNNAIEKIFYSDCWFIHVKDTLSGLEKNLIPPNDRFWADPFPVYHDGKYYVFVEEWIHSISHAHLSVIILDQNLNIESHQKILDTGYHLSYPFVFWHQDKLFMIPETKNNHTISLYQCDQFPTQWSLHHNLIEDIEAVDSTLVFYNDIWWLFTTVNPKSGESAINDELNIYLSSDIFSKKWTAHPLNPIKSTPIGARPAGNIYMHNKELYRPAQDCSKYYGYGVLIYKITRLTPFEYEEILEETHYPNPKGDYKRTHTYNSCKNLLLTDRFKFRFKNRNKRGSK